MILSGFSNYLKNAPRTLLMLFLVLMIPLAAFAVPGGIDSNLTLWLDASNSSSLFQDSCGGTASTSDGHRIGCWEDSSGNSYDFIQSGNLRPSLRTGSQAINFNPSLQFDGSEDHMEDADGESYVNGASEFTTFTVVNSDSASNNGYIFNSESDGTASEAPWGLRFDGSGDISGRTNTLKTGIDTGTKTLYEGDENNLAVAYPLMAGVEWASGEAPVILRNGRNVAMDPSTTKSGTLSNGDYVRLGDDANQEFWDGTIAEIIYYNIKLNSTAREKVETYLAIKYGITLEATSDYIDSSGNILWDASNHSSYTDEITGIARDDASNLNQTKSKSSNPNGIVTIEAESNLDDGDAIIWANNNGTATWTTSQAPSAYRKLTKTWIAQETNEVGSLTISVDVEDSDYDIPALLYGSSYYLIYDSDGDESLLDEAPIQLYDDGTNGDDTSSDNVWTINSIDLENNTIFSFATKITPLPGAVDNVEFWVKADDGVNHSSNTVTSWADQIGLNTMYASGDPKTNELEVNFNNMIQLDGVDDYFDGNTIIGFREVFLVSDPSNDAPLLSSNESIPSSTQEYWLRVITGKAYIGDSDPDYIHSDNDIPNRTVIFNHEMVGGAQGTSSRITFDGENQSVTSISGNDPLDSFSNRPRIGKSTDSGFTTEFSGSIGEIIVYNRSLNGTERSKVHSYLAIKYGITLDSSRDYLDSAGDIIFASISTHQNFTYDIAGIGRDDGSLLNQSKSQSINDDSIIQMSNATSVGNTEFLIWGNDNESLEYISENAPLGKKILNRTWRVDQTGSIGEVDIVMNISQLAIDTEENLFLIKDTTPDFSSTSSISSNYSDLQVVIFNGIDFAANDYFTLAQSATNPMIEFVSPTPNSEIIINTNSIYTNISSNSSRDHYTFLDLDDSLTLWLRMDDENSTGGLTDISQSSHNASPFGNTVINSTGRFGRGAHFDGNGDYIDLVASNELIQDANLWAMSVWFNARDIGTDNFDNRIITVRNSSSNSAISLTLGDNDQLQFFYRDQSGTGNVNNVTAISTNTWYHYAALYNGSTYKLYVNGVLNKTIVDSIAQFSSHNGRIGANPAGSSEYFNGSIDEMLIFNRSLSDNEILALYNASANQYDVNQTNLGDGLHTLTGYAVDSDGLRNQTETRNITIDTIAPQISYISPTPSNNSILSLTSFTINVSVTEVNEGNITFRLFNSSLDLINSTTLGAGNRSTTFTSLLDGEYYYNVTSYDLSNNLNTTPLRRVIINTENPSVTLVSPSSEALLTQITISINATVTDSNGIDTVLANLTYPNSTLTQLTLSNIGGDVYGINFTIPLLSGDYNLTIIANDTLGSLNSTETSNFLVNLNNPLDISPILGWYDASDNSTLFTDSSCSTQVSADDQVVECWENKAGGINATVASGQNGARFRSLSSERISNSTTLRFNKTNSTVYQTGIDIRANTTEDVTIFSVYRPRSNDTSDQGQAIWGVDDGSWDRFYYNLFAFNAGLGTDGIDDGLISLGGASSGLSIDGAGIVDETFLLTAVYDGNVSGGTNSGPVNGSQIYFDAVLQTRFTDESHATAAQTQMFLGWDGDNGAYDGDLAEVIVYDRVLTLCQIELVNNYLGEKYGKDFSGVSNDYGFGTPHNNDINGIKEYAGNCSVNIEITSAKSSIATIFNPNALDLNDSLTFAHDDSGFTLDRDVPDSYTRRLSQSWRVDVDNTPGNVSVSFDISRTQMPSTGVNFSLLIDSDLTFNDSTVHTSGVSVSGTTVTFTNVEFSNGEYFTLAMNESHPSVSFESPTPADGSTQNEDFITVNLSSSAIVGDHYSFVDFDKSLVFWMRMDDLNGSGHPVDISGYGNNGTLIGSPVINKTGVYGDAIHLDGVSDFINVSDDPSLQLGDGDLTISSWFNLKGYKSEDQQILVKRVFGGSDYEIQVEDTKRIVVYLGEGGGPFTNLQSTFNVSLDTWYHTVMVNRNGTFLLYVNGVLEDNASFSGNVSSVAPLQIGNDPAKPTEFFNGSIDEVLIFNRSFTQDEVSALYNATANQYFNNFTNLSSGNHTLTGYAVSETGKKNQTETRGIIIDTTPPNVDTLIPTSGTNFNVTEPIEIGANATDSLSSISDVLATITLPNGTDQNLSLSNALGDKYNNSFTQELVGRHNVTVFANDSGNNINYSETTNFRRTAGGVLDFVTFGYGSIDATFNITGNESGILNMTITIGSYEPFNTFTITNYNASASSDLLLFISNQSGDSDDFNETFVIDTSRVDYGNLTAVVNLSGGNLYQCSEVNVTTLGCNDSLEYSEVTNITLTPGIYVFGTVFSNPDDIGDATLYERYPNSNYGTNTKLRVGRQGTSGNKVSRTAIRFGIDNLPQRANITNALLGLYFYDIPGTDKTDDQPHSVHRVTGERDWPEGDVTWNDYNSSNTWTSSGGDFNATATDTINISSSEEDAYVYWNVTSDVIDFVQNSSINFGWIIKNVNEATTKTRRDFRSKDHSTESQRPILTLNYSIPNSPPNVSGVTLNSSLGMNGPDENLTLYVSSVSDSHNDTVVNITNWFRDNVSIAVLNMPFEGNLNEDNNATDYSSFSNNGTVTGASWGRTTGKIGGSYLFDGSSGDYIQLPLSDELNITTNITLEAWVKSVDNTHPGADPTIIAKYGSGSTRSFFLGIDDDGGSNDDLVFQMSSSCSGFQGSINVNNAFNTPGEWVYVVGTWDGSTMRLYKDGVQIGTDTFSGPICDSTSPIYIGDSPAQEGFEGYIDEVKIYNFSLSAEQIYENYLAGNQSKGPRTIVSNETILGEAWHACVTPNDGFEDGTQECSNNLTIALDSTPPSVFAINTSPSSTYNLTDTVQINANVTDDATIGTVLANITYPNSTISQQTMSNIGGDRFAVNFTVPNLFGNYTIRIIANDSAGNINDSETVTFEVQNSVPQASGVSINGGSDITLSSAQNVSINGTATLTDLNGYNDISSVTGYFFITEEGVGTANNNSKRYSTTCNDNGDGSGSVVTYKCTFNITHYAIPTDAGSNRSSTNWTFRVSPQDSQSTGTNGSASIEINTLAAFNITPSTIDFGALTLGQNTTNINQQVNITNEGNVGLDMLISGTNLSCNTSSIAVTQLEYENSPFNYGLGTNLQESSVEFDLDIQTGSQTTPLPIQTTYYGLGIPSASIGGLCSGTVTLTAQADPNND